MFRQDINEQKLLHNQTLPVVQTQTLYRWQWNQRALKTYLIIITTPVNARHCGVSLRKCLLLQTSHTCMLLHGSKLHENWLTEFRLTKCRGQEHLVCVTWRLFRNVPGSKWRLLSNILARVDKTGEMAANWNNSRPWIGLFQGAKCDNLPKCNLEFAWGKSIVVAVTSFSLFHIILFLLIILPTEFLCASSARHRTPMGPSHTRGRTEVSEPLRNERR